MNENKITVNEYLERKNYRSIVIIHKNFILVLRLLRNKDPKIPKYCEGIGQLPVKAAEIKKEKELILYV
ncbi:MAG: hypothetical protein ACOYEB_07365 [Enterococcus lemanii]|jgi:hypothetical protein